MASSNSSKTAHVMNLLSKNRAPAAESPAEPQAEPAVQAETAPQAQPAPQTAPDAAPAPQAEPARTAPVAPIISSINADAAVSSQIKDALEAELEEAPKAPPAAPPAPAQQSAPIQEAEPVQTEVPVQQAAPAQPEAPVQAAPPVQEAPAPAAPVQEAEPLQPEPSAEEHAYVNVMQLLVDEKADEYMKMFGICCCDKCRVDVRAFALNHLPPKYVVMSERERVPRLTVYESRFASDVTAQLIKACKKVMLTPHHSRKDN